MVTKPLFSLFVFSDSLWAAWTAYSLNVTTGAVFKVRTRECDSTKHQNQGVLVCPGSGHESTGICSGDKCHVSDREIEARDCM